MYLKYESIAVPEHNSTSVYGSKITPVNLNGIHLKERSNVIVRNVVASRDDQKGVNGA